MPGATLGELLDRNTSHVESLPPDHFSGVQDGQAPSVVSVCCSDSRVSQEGMWAVEEPGWLFTAAMIGNQAWDRYAGERVVEGSVLYPLAYTGTETVAVVGHTGCGAVTAALERVRDGGDGSPPGVAKWLDLLEPVVADALDTGVVDPDRDASVVNQLVEANVDRQVAFLRDSPDVPSGVNVFGFVYDFQDVYGDSAGRAYLVNANGDTDAASLRERVGPRHAEHVARRLSAG